MLNLIKKNIGGSVKISKENQWVIWVVNDTKQILNIIKIFDIYPPITTRLRAQLAFLTECLNRDCID